MLVEGSGDFGKSVHHRLYTVADTPKTEGSPEITIVVRRCNYIDDYSGEEFIGVNSNYLCDRRPGDKVTITGPFGMPFQVPADKNANLLLIGLGTGIAPFRALVKHIYSDVGDWKGKDAARHTDQERANRSERERERDRDVNEEQRGRAIVCSIPFSIIFGITRPQFA